MFIISNSSDGDDGGVRGWQWQWQWQLAANFKLLQFIQYQHKQLQLQKIITTTTRKQIYQILEYLSNFFHSIFAFETIFLLK